MHDPARLIDALRKLNTIHFQKDHPPCAHLSISEQKHWVENLRSRLPTALLAHHDRCLARGKASLAIVRGGVCGACHLRLPRGHQNNPRAGDLDVCDHCGTFLEWPTVPQTTPPQICAG